MAEDPRLLNRDSPEYKAANRKAAIERVHKLLRVAFDRRTIPEEAANAERLARKVVADFQLDIKIEAIKDQTAVPRYMQTSGRAAGKSAMFGGEWKSGLDAFKGEGIRERSKPKDDGFEEPEPGRFE